MLQRWYCALDEALYTGDGALRGPYKQGNCGERHYSKFPIPRSGRITACDGVDCRAYVKFGHNRR